MKPTINLVWFRNNLRVSDNTPLREAIQGSEQVIGLYCFDPTHYTNNEFGIKKIEKFRAQFLLETVQDLKTRLAALNITLLTPFDTARGAYESISEAYQVKNVFYQSEWTKEEQEVEVELKKMPPLKNTTWNEYYDQFLFHPKDIPYSAQEIPPVFTVFRKKLESETVIRKAITPMPLESSNLITLDTLDFPTTRQLGFKPFAKDPRSAFPYQGGETHAIKRLSEYFWTTKQLSSYKKTRNGLIGTSYSSKLSAWLANGSISPRTIYEAICTYEIEVEKNESTYWLFFELLWRDYFKYVSLKHKNRIFYRSGIKGRDYKWITCENSIRAWIDGETEETFVNANMIELKKTGWMSNRGRQNVASYFAKTLQLDWRIGAAYFESLLIDYDVHSNYGNWMYVSGVGNDPRDRVFNVSLQASRYDPQQKFQKLWSLH